MSKFKAIKWCKSTIEKDRRIATVWTVGGRAFTSYTEAIRLKAKRGIEGERINVMILTDYRS